VGIDRSDPRPDLGFRGALSRGQAAVAHRDQRPDGAIAGKAALVWWKIALAVVPALIAAAIFLWMYYQR
jgi:hypothetical protein